MFLVFKILNRLKRYYRYALNILVRLSWMETFLGLLKLKVYVRGRSQTDSICVPITKLGKINHLIPLVDRGVGLHWIENTVVISIDNRIAIHTSEVDQSSGDTILEAFFEEEYNFIHSDVAGKSVLDVGANIGDVAISFCLKGAREVVSLEPVGPAYGYLEKNIYINQANVTPYNIGLSCITHKETWKIKPYASASASGKNRNNLRQTRIFDECKVDLMSPEDFHKSVNYKSFDVIKIDCEGYEYEIMNDDFLDRFQPKLIFIEYHSGPQHLLSLLQAHGFSTNLNRKSDKLGIISAKRK